MPARMRVVLGRLSTKPHMKQIDVLMPETLVIMLDELAKRMGVDRDNLVCLAVYEKMNRDATHRSRRERARDLAAAPWKTSGDGSDAPYRPSI